MTNPRNSSIRAAARPLRRLAGAAVALVALAALGSCAYYNTFYTARKYYDRALQGQPYRVEPGGNPDLSSLNKSMDYSKKLMANYPRSKWVDDAYLLWARAFLAKNDPLQTVSMLDDFPVRYPDSPRLEEARFYRAVALRQARRYEEALRGLDTFLVAVPKDKLTPYALLERARTLRSLDRGAEASEAAGELVRRWPKSPLAVMARISRAESDLERGAYDSAREDFRFLGAYSSNDDERLGYLLRESECLEAGRQFDEALSLLRDALGHEREPIPPDTTGGRPLIITQAPGYDRFGRLLTRIGTVQLMSGDVAGALASYRRVVEVYPRTPVAAEAQYRLGYAYEVGADDFERARVEYGKVREQNPGSPFVAQATQRQNTLDQLARFRSASGDSADRRAQGAFLLAEQYLFQLDKPDRAITEYARIAEEYRGDAWAGKALNAQAWVLRHKFDKPAEAESLLWKVVNEYPATEAQLAARDYLEAEGRHVPPELIKLPPEPAPVVDTTANRPLTPPPAGTPRLGSPGAVSADSAARLARSRSLFGGPPVADPMRGPPADSTRSMVRDSASVVADPTRGAAGRFATPPAGGTIPAMVSGTSPDSAASPAPGSAAASAASPTASPAPDSAATSAASPTTSPAAAPPAPVPAGGTAAGTPPASAAVNPVAAAPVDTAATAADTTARRPLPPIERSPVVPGITFPTGRPRQFGAPSLASTAESAPIPIRPAPGVPTFGAPPPDSTRAGARAAADTLGTRRAPPDFRPRGSRFQ